MKKWIGILFCAGLCAFALASCSASRKKHKCNTCPKWEDRIELTRH